jgi:Ca-activated chloride channel homolog
MPGTAAAGLAAWRKVKKALESALYIICGHTRSIAQETGKKSSKNIKKGAEMKKNSLNITIRSDLDLVSNASETERVLEIEVEAPQAGGKQERIPLNLAIVLDHSGSMTGAKLDYARQAGIHLLERLEEKDHAAVVVYDDEVNVLSAAVAMTTANRNALKNALQRVETGGSTCLSGGWLAGCSEVAKANLERSVNRVLLLTDGLANQGITDLEELARQARELCARGVSTSTFGVGADFNEHLLEAMSNQGGGIFHFIESPQDIHTIFQQEFKELAAVTARDVEIALEIPAQVKTKVLGSWREERVNGQQRIFLGSMYSGRKQLLYTQLTIPAASEEKLIIPAVVRAKDENGNLLEAKTELVFKYAAPEDVQKAVPQTDVLERHAAVAVADALAESLRLDRAGRRREAIDHLRGSTNLHRAHLRESTAMSFDQLQSSMADGMSPMDLKRSHQQSYNMKKMRMQGQEFRLHQPSGHLVIEVNGMMALVDTGSPVSVGRLPQINFLGRDYRLLPSFQQVVNMDFLSDKVGVQLDVLMGMDILRHFYFIIDCHRRLATFSLDALFWNGQHRIALKNLLMGVPTAQAQVNGSPLEMFVDIGSALSYVPERLTQGCRQVRTAKDFFPGASDFETPVFEVPFSLAGESMTLECGANMPDILALGLRVAGVEGILGMDLARKYVLGFAMPDDEMFLIEKIQ